jgi:hypothetical protein
LRRAGHEAEIVPIPFNGRLECRLVEQMLACQLFDLEESMGVRIDRLIGLTFPGYLVPHSVKVIWLQRPFRPAYDLWGTAYATLHLAPDGEQLRRLIHDADSRLISRTHGVFVPSRSAADRLRLDCGITATPLRAPPSYAERYGHSGDGDFFLLPLSTESPPREELILQAMRRTRNAVRLHILAGAAGPSVKRMPDAEAASLDDRVIRGDATDDERRALFGRCLGVIFAPLEEGDGTVALEAMLSEKALITCNDAGGVVELVYDGQTGFVCPPSPDALADVLDRLWEDRVLARRLGRAARASYQDLRLSWNVVIERLLA